MTKRIQKRERTGQYAFDGRLDRLCACGHILGVHSAGSPADCLFYSLAPWERSGQPGEDKPNCGCQKFRQSKRTIKPKSGDEPMKLSKNNKTAGRQLREFGAADFKAGKPIDAFQQLPLKRHTESFRASYEIGWRAAKQESKR